MCLSLGAVMHKTLISIFRACRGYIVKVVRITFFSLMFQLTMAEYTPALLEHLGTLSRNDAIAAYYHSGYTIKEIIGFLALRHNIALSERQVHRILRSMNLYRRNNQSPLEDIITAVLQELSNSGENSGYRQMRQRLLLNHQVTATSELVRLVLNVVDPSGVISRRARRLQRRIYTNRGPNFAIHIDGWDKLKPFGVSVHGAIDGYSRRILWLHACNSNKKPEYIAKQYLDFIKEINGVPVRVYGDRGTENVIVRDFQYALRWNDQDPFQGQSSFVYVSSNRNVRIERFWRSLREMCGNTWINYFKDLCDLEVLDTSDNIHLECVRFCFLGLINDDLRQVSRLWNQHRVRPTRFAECPSGKPDVLFFQPELSGGRDYKLPVPNDIAATEQEFCVSPPAYGVSDEFKALAEHILNEKQLIYPPETRDEAAALFIEITSSINNLE